VNQSPDDSIAAPGASNPRPFGYESYALTGCAIRHRVELIDNGVSVMYSHSKRMERGEA